MSNRRRIKSTTVEDKIISFEETWFLKGDILVEHDSDEEDICILTKEINANTFKFKGKAKPNTVYKPIGSTFIE